MYGADAPHTVEYQIYRGEATHSHSRSHAYCAYSPRPRKFKGSEGNSSVSDSQNCSPLIIFHAYARKKQYGDFKLFPSEFLGRGEYPMLEMGRLRSNFAPQAKPN